MQNWATHFESIGDNCEFGFVQRLQGHDAGSLLKWCSITDHRHLLKFLELPFSEFYRFENLVPKHDDMCEDTSCGILFHTELYSTEVDGRRLFTGDEAHQRHVYQLEYAKRARLYERLIEWLVSGEKILLFKQNGTNDLEIAKAIGEAILRYGPNAKLFYVTDLVPERAGEVEHITGNLYRGFIERFAPYWPATDTKVEYWQSLCERMLLLSGHVSV